MSDYPCRIVCLTPETTETLYLLGEEWRIVGISGFTVRPSRARKEKPRVAAFTAAKIDKILVLQPDLVLGFSDLQADIAAELIRHGINVHVFNQRSVADIMQMIRVLGGMIGCQEKTDALLAQLHAHIEQVRQQSHSSAHKPRVYFEEWDSPLITGIRWVSELIEIAGGEDCFVELRDEALARNRILADPQEVVRRQPDIIIGSWCGKKFQATQLSSRPGWHALAAVRENELHEIKAPLILQPGPSVLTAGLDALHAIIVQWRLKQQLKSSSTATR